MIFLVVIMPMLGVAVPIKVYVGDGGSAAAALPDATGTPTAAEAGQPKVERKHSMIYSTGERVVNLADPGAFRYLKVEVVLEMASDVDPVKMKAEAYKEKQKEMADRLEPRRPAIEDSITTLLTSKTVADISGPQGKESLKAELKMRLGELLPDEEIRSVYFTQFIIQ